MDAHACDAKKAEAVNKLFFKKFIELHSTNFVLSFKNCINCQIKDNSNIINVPFLVKIRY